MHAIKRHRSKPRRRPDGPQLRVVSESDGIADLVDRLNTPDIRQAMRDAGIEPLPPLNESAEWCAAEYETTPQERLIAATANGEDLYRAAIGKPGTHIIDGRIEVEQNTRVRPYQVRGRLGRPGLNEEVYRSEPVVFKSVNELSSLIEGATYEPDTPEGTPAKVEKEIKRQHRAIRRAMLEGDFLTNAATVLKHGFAPFEITWKGLQENKPTVDTLEFREQASIERWLFDERQSKLDAVEFRTSGTASEHYIIPAGSSSPTDSRFLLCNIFATGLNLEGVSPIRVVIGLRKLKELILQSFGVSYQRFAVPIAVIAHEFVEAANLLVDIGAAEHEAEVQDLVNRLQELRSRLPSVIPVPAGRTLRWENPSNDMPDPTPMLNYIDAMIALVFSNEGALLGTQSFGSYAMASVSDAKFMRSAPLYAGRIAKALTRLLHMGLRFNGVDLDELDELPLYGFRFNGTQDASKWLDDLVKTMGADTSSWPEEVRRAAAARLGLSSTALDNITAPTGEEGSDA